MSTVPAACGLGSFSAVGNGSFDAGSGKSSTVAETWGSRKSSAVTWGNDATATSSATVDA